MLLRPVQMSTVQISALNHYNSNSHTRTVSTLVRNKHTHHIQMMHAYNLDIFLLYLSTIHVLTSIWSFFALNMAHECLRFNCYCHLKQKKLKKSTSTLLYIVHHNCGTQCWHLFLNYEWTLNHRFFQFLQIFNLKSFLPNIPSTE